MAALQHYDVRILAGRLHELLVHGLDGGEVLIYDGLHGAAAFLHVTQGAAENAHVGVGFHENADVHQLPQAGILKNEDALHDDHRRRPDEDGLIGAVMVGIGVHGAADGMAGFQLPELLHHEVGVEGIGVVIILLAALLEGDILALVVVVVVDDADVGAEMGGQMLREGGFAAAGAAGDADDHGVHKR